jgi:hypothetical protein
MDNTFGILVSMDENTAMKTLASQNTKVLYVVPPCSPPVAGRWIDGQLLEGEIE